MVTDVLEENTASIFRVEVCQVRELTGCIENGGGKGMVMEDRCEKLETQMQEEEKCR
jgi:hypothetical protein